MTSILAALSCTLCTVIFLVVTDVWCLDNGLALTPPMGWFTWSRFMCNELKVRQKGLKFGIYTDVGPKTCDGFPGSYGHYKTDARTFADWGVDYVKVDGCNVKPSEMDTLYPAFGQAILDSGYDMVYSCEWPFYQMVAGIRMAHWAIVAAPLVLSNDLRDVPQESKQLLLNKYIIAVDQDELGLFGKRVCKMNNLGVRSRGVIPQLANGEKSLAVLIHNTKVLGGPVEECISFFEPWPR
ncbi:hypothetical protein HPB49_001541 [Dermacentor silvarum]|uniref:Uncharacterized protein n=1 Tax=Dermacentor silvarum TaxID=543639 RepID=A0ACB8CUG9_DERSI|nr:hypothetical protein HPB49_001541 [Dermacentor silvarum]